MLEGSRAPSIEPMWFGESICGNETCLHIAPRLRRVCRCCAANTCEPVEPRGDLTSERMSDLKRGLDIAILGSNRDPRDLVRSFLSRERQSSPDKRMPWVITDGTGVDEHRAQEVAYQVAQMATHLIDPMYQYRSARGKLVERLINPAFLLCEVRAEMHRYREAVLSTSFLVARKRSQDAATIDITHPATNIRARFSYGATTHDSLFVRSKQQGVPILEDPDGTVPSNPEDTPTLYLGYGVGTTLYRVAASLAPPQVRWARGLTHDGSEGVRRKLHQEDPWRWAVSRCESPRCVEHWDAPGYRPEAFHPRALKAGSPAVLPPAVTVREGRPQGATGR